MSGGGSGTPSGNPPDGGCLPIYKDIPLFSPVPDVLSKMKVGSELEFEIHDSNGRKSLRVEFNGETAGAVTKHAPKIISCIEQGHKYIAIVTFLDGGSCGLEARMIS